MLSKFMGLLIALPAIFFAVPADAGFFSSILADGITHLQDSDSEILLTRNALGEIVVKFDAGDGSARIAVGDYLVGSYFLESAGPAGGSLTPLPSPNGEGITGVFVTKFVGDANQTFFPFDYQLGPAEQDVWDSLGLTRNNDGTLVTFWENLSGGLTENFSSDLLGNPLDPVIASLQSAELDSLLFEFGFTGDVVDGLPTAGLNEFWDARSADNDTLAVGENDVLFRAALGLTYNSNPLLIFSPHDFLNFGAETIGQLSGRVKQSAVLGNSLPVLTDTDFYISAKIVPEPSTLAIWGVLSVSGVFLSARRRKTLRTATA